MAQRRNPWARTYEPVTEESFRYSARKLSLPIRERRRAWEWLKYLEARQGPWPSAHHAVHAWIAGQLAERLAGRSG